MKKQILVTAFLFLASLTMSIQAAAQRASNSRAPAPNETTPSASNDPNVAVGRGYIVPKAEGIQDGVKISVEIFHNTKAEPVSLWLQAAVNDGKGKMEVFPIEILSDKVADNPTNFRSNREFKFNFAELNKALRKAAPNAKNLQIGPGTPLAVYAYWDQAGHQWGSFGRGGVVYMPGEVPKAIASGASAAAARPDALDLAFPIDSQLTNIFNDRATASGLKSGGQVRSRVEGEGKFQIPVGEFDRIRTELFALAKDPAAAAATFGKEWSFKLEDRYMQRDGSKNLILDAQGFPTPDPMVDTYYDNDNMDAASKDMAIRYRWTEQNKTGSWNFKPGLSNATPEGVVYRTEFAVDTTDDKPETVQKFVDSDHVLNPFKEIRNLIPGAKPSEFLKPAVKITDHRYKFKLQHQNGLIIELSLDSVTAENLRKPGAKSQFVQLEMDIDHLATASTNTVKGLQVWLGNTKPQEAIKPWLDALDDKAFFDGRAVMHDESDIHASSPLMKKHGHEFVLATDAIVRLRDKTVGSNWLPGAQKFAYAAYQLEMVKPNRASSSVRSVFQRIKELGTRTGNGNSCRVLFAGFKER